MSSVKCSRVRVAFLAAAVVFAVLLGSPSSAAEVEKIIFSSNANGDFDIWMMNPDGTGLETLVIEPGDQYQPHSSPDGTRVAYLSNADGPWSIRVLDLKTGDVSIGVLPRWLGFRWRYDGSGFVTAYGASCQGDLHYLEFDGTLSLLHAESGRQNPMAVNPINGEIFFESDPCWSPSMTIKALDPVTGAIRVVQGPDGRAEDGGGISGDGLFFSYAKTDASYYPPHRIYIMGTDGTNERMISRREGLGDNYSSFSPDGSNLVFGRGWSNSDWDIVRVGFDGVEETVILDDDNLNWYIEWASLVLCHYGPEEQPLFFERQTGRPIVESVTWESCGGSGTLLIENNLVTGGWVTLNGIVVAGPGAFDEEVYSIEIPVELNEGNNTLEVQLFGAPGTSLSIEFIED